METNGAMMIKKMSRHFYQARPFSKQVFLLALGASLQLGQMTLASAQDVGGGCGPLSTSGQFGPFDYRAERYKPESTYGSQKALLFIVENAHFTPEVESLRRGKTTALPGTDIAYTLHAFPNHHRALIAIEALGEKEKKTIPTGSPYEVECWFKRAITFRSDDNIVRLLYASFLNKKSRESEAAQQLEYVASKAGDNAFTYNNIGLIYFDMKDYDKAVVFAHKAYALGLGIPTLKDLLTKEGKWVEPSGADPTEPTNSSQ